MNGSPKVDFRKSIEADQVDRLRSLLTKLKSSNRFYSLKLGETNFSFDTLTLRVFRSEMPFTFKNELIEDQRNNPPFGSNLTFPLEEYTRFNQTSATTGQPMTWLDTPETWNWMLGNWDRVYSAANVSVDDRIININNLSGLMLNKIVIDPKITVSLKSDKKTTIHMGERDCSVQRKYQKLIEESPSPVLDEKTRQNLLNKTVEMVSKLNYEGAGTVEFIYDNGKFFFLEMNTRIQVEHPVSEIRGGIDIVKEQIKIASKGKTSLKQSDITFRGHVIECRINAEDPSKDFQPSPGTINVCHQPSGFRTRVDGAIFQGCKITPYYDSLICKLICQGRDREEAIQRLQRSLSEFVIEGIATTIDLHKKILSHKKFINSDFDTNWLAKENFY